jgi:SAM-dependent methyltransferase
VTEWLQSAGRRFARLTTEAVVSRPVLWRLFRRPLRAHFDLLAATWENRRGPEMLVPLEAALDRVGGTPRRALDLGTGTGKGARVIARRFPVTEVVGVDLSPAMVAEARRLLPADLDGRVTFTVGDAAALPFADAAFDLVVLLNMIPFFGELGRVTSPSGTLVITFSWGPETPIYVPSETVRARLSPLGFVSFEELAAGEGTALVARRRRDALAVESSDR